MLGIEKLQTCPVDRRKKRWDNLLDFEVDHIGESDQRKCRLPTADFKIR